MAGEAAGAGGCAGASPVGVSPATPAMHRRLPWLASCANWSGYADDSTKGNTYTTITGKWKEPRIGRRLPAVQLPHLDQVLGDGQVRLHHRRHLDLPRRRDHDDQLLRRHQGRTGPDRLRPAGPAPSANATICASDGT